MVSRTFLDGRDAFKRAAEHGCERDADIGLGIRVHDLLQLCKGLLVSSSDICLVVALTDGDNIGDILYACVYGILNTPEVGCKSVKRSVGVLFNAGLCKLGRVRHLRDGLGADKGRHFHLSDTGIEHSADQIHLLIEREHLLEVLPTVARAYFEYIDFVCHCFSSLLNYA